MKWIKNTANKADATLTLAVISLAVVLFKFLLSETTVGPVSTGQLDAGVVAAILTPTLAAYCTRRFSDNKTNSKKDKNEKSN